MLTFDATWRLIRSGKTSPLMVGLAIEELENNIEFLQQKQEIEKTLSEHDRQLLRDCLLKRYLLIKKLREHLRYEPTKGKD